MALKPCNVGGGWMEPRDPPAVSGAPFGQEVYLQQYAA